ncbi:hypothetical protein WL32_38435 [Burkholderia cepacia]|uniref:hypothetical protein n=1 Tax=Burkholderia cepacia TaxID=292 RepID=UPI00075C558D|nr:hypothetical protein [Burkholderia cepacia]KWB12321.1 hypothetical protein WL32_38435 [Burkholderia cepacia]
MAINGVVAYLGAVLAGCAAMAAGGVAAQEMAQPRANVLAQSAQTVGVRRCYAAVDQVSSRMLAGTRRADVALDWDRHDADGEPFFAIAGLEYPDTSAALSLTVVPETKGGCTILVERMSSAPMSCKAVAASELRDYKGTPLVKAVTVYANPGRPRETVTLVDTPPACLIIRRQVQFRWGAPQ